MRIPAFLSCIIFCLTARSQTFTGNAGAIQNNGVETYFTCAVSGLSSANLDSIYGLEEVCLTISHPKVEELYVYLISPAGRTVEITEGASCPGQDYASTCFNNSAASPITATTAPYSGIYRPIGHLGRFNDGQTGIGTWTLVVKDYLAFVNSGSVISWSLKFGNAPSKPVILTATNLPIVIINTNNLIINDFKQIMNFAVIYNGPGQLNHPGDPKNNYNGKAAIHIRGNTTRNFEKKAYSVELRDNNNQKLSAPILGMSADSDWELIAEYQDKALMRIPLTYQLARKMGKYASRTKNVEVIINGEYHGVYALVEKVKRNPYRVNIRKLSGNDNTMPYVSGGYLLKIDRSDSPGWFSLLSGNSQNGSHFYYQYDDPKDSVITPQQRTYIKTFMNDFETLMAANNYADPSTGYPSVVDVASCVDVFIVNEMSKNVDGYRLSSYLYKQDVAQGGMLYLGPVWDYDIAWHNCNYANTFDPTGWEYQIQDTVHPGPTWWNRFMQDSNFVNAVSCRWKSLRQNVLSNNSVYNYIDSVANELNEPQKRNFRQWPIMGTYIFPNPQPQANNSYAAEVADLKTWIFNRFSWLDGALQTQKNCLTLGINRQDLQDNRIEVYPNPMETSTTFKIQLNGEAHVSLLITDGLGRTVYYRPAELKPGGENKLEFKRTDLNGGIYFYQVKINGVVHAGKIIVK